MEQPEGERKRRIKKWSEIGLPLRPKEVLLRQSMSIENLSTDVKNQRTSVVTELS